MCRRTETLRRKLNFFWFLHAVNKTKKKYAASVSFSQSLVLHQWRVIERLSQNTVEIEKPLSITWKSLEAHQVHLRSYSSKKKKKKKNKADHTIGILCSFPVDDLFSRALGNYGY